MERKCENCMLGEPELKDFSCDLGFCHDENLVCKSHQFREGLGKDIDIVSCGSFFYGGEGFYIVERDENGKIVRFVWLLNTGEDYYNFCIGMWDRNALTTDRFKMSIKPEDNEGVYDALDEFYDLSLSQIFDCIGFGSNWMSIEREDDEITLTFCKGVSFLDSKDSVEVYLGDCFTCTEYDAFDSLFQKFALSSTSEDRKTIMKLLSLKRSI